MIKKKDRISIIAVVAFLMLCLVVSFFVPPVDATAISKEVNVTAVTVGNGTVEIIRVEGVLYTCTANVCGGVAVVVECPDCPACPTVNMTAVEGNLSGKMDALKEWWAAHNSSSLEEEDREWFEDTYLDELVSGTEVVIRGLMEETITKKQEEFDNLTREKEGLNAQIWLLQSDAQQKNATITQLRSELRNKEDTINSMGYDLNMALVAFFIIVVVVLVCYLRNIGGLGTALNRRKRATGGVMTPEERDFAREEERIQKADTATKLEAARRKAEEAEARLAAVKDGEAGTTGEPRITQIYGEEEKGVEANADEEEKEMVIDLGGWNLEETQMRRVQENIEFLLQREDYLHVDGEKIPTKRRGVNKEVHEVDMVIARDWLAKTFKGHFEGGGGAPRRFARGE